jgi:hypothetical protein
MAALVQSDSVKPKISANARLIIDDAPKLARRRVRAPA